MELFHHMTDLGVANLAEELQIPYLRPIKIKKRDFAEEALATAENPLGCQP
ncbi:hypothetical protein BT93_J1142 [Corymbia citriodora subsp. variegata]|nr:hypothetical protein BT93_J1142 [Corymbia citriodora subsp. variegata]